MFALFVCAGVVCVYCVAFLRVVCVCRCMLCFICACPVCLIFIVCVGVCLVLFTVFFICMFVVHVYVEFVYLTGARLHFAICVCFIVEWSRVRIWLQDFVDFLDSHTPKTINKTLIEDSKLAIADNMSVKRLSLAVSKLVG